MNIIDFTYILEHPNLITSVQTTELKKVLREFPYLQPARAIYLKGLFNKSSYMYNSELKLLATYTTNRTILFDFITSVNFKKIPSDTTNDIGKSDKNISEINTDFNKLKTIENSIIQSINQAQNSTEKYIINWEPAITMVNLKSDTDYIDKAENLKEQKNEEIVDFNRNESHSFSQWLQLTKLTPIDRSKDIENTTENVEDNKKQNKFELIDKFIESNPKIGNAKIVTPSINIEKSNQENSSLMTETLAKIYLNQKKYQKAIQAYEILILKYPEKSSLFAERIIEIKKIQNNNN